ncbi:MAG: adenosine deaminase, partial [Microbacterium sp.]|nr:adenosine deaminase [Microbacterium sp.]
AELLRTPHAGELAGPDSVRACVDVLGADRIQHGIRAAEDPALLEMLAERYVCLDVCPTSNIVLGSVSAYDQHPLPVLLDSGVRVSLNADDPVMFGCDILSEYELCRDRFELTDDQLARIARDSMLASAAPASAVEAALADIDAWRTSAG